MEAFFIGLLLLLVGGLLTFTGYQSFKTLIPLFGFLAGFSWGAQAVAVGMGIGFLSTVSGWIVGFVVAIAVAAISLFYEVAVSVLAASFGYWMTLGLLTAIGFQSGGFLTTVLAATAGIALAVEAWHSKAPKWLLVVLTAAVGSTVVIGGLLTMFGVVPVWTLGTDIVSLIIRQSFFWSISWALLATVGLFSQAVASQAITADISEYLADSYTYSTGMAGAKGGQAKKKKID